MRRKMQNIFFFINLLCLSYASIEYRFVAHNDSVTLALDGPCHRDCKLMYTRTLTGFQSSSIQRTVVENGEATQFYSNRIQVEDDGCKVTFLRAKFNDRGGYEYQCGSGAVKEVELEVLDPDVQSAEAGGNATLHCLVDTNGLTDLRVHWKMLLNGSLEDPLQKTGSLLNGSLEDPLQKTGGEESGFALTLTGLRQSDQGIYVCTVFGRHGGSEEKTRGKPVKLQVQRQNTRTPPAACQGGSVLIVAFIGALIGAIVVVLLGFLLYAVKLYILKLISSVSAMIRRTLGQERPPSTATAAML